MLPLPPIELMRLVGPTDTKAFDNPSGRGALDEFWSGYDYSQVLDFGCGCGRIARQMLQQEMPPSRYLGIDLNGELLGWASEYLGSHAFRFEQIHPLQPFPGGNFTLAVAVSVFTHILERDVRFYLANVPGR